MSRRKIYRGRNREHEIPITKLKKKHMERCDGSGHQNTHRSNRHGWVLFCFVFLCERLKIREKKRRKKKTYTLSVLWTAFSPVLAFSTWQSPYKGPLQHFFHFRHIFLSLISFWAILIKEVQKGVLWNRYILSWTLSPLWVRMIPWIVKSSLINCFRFRKHMMQIWK